MNTTNYYLLEELRVQQLNDCHDKARMNRICREAGIDRRGWLNCQICRALTLLGRGLVASGRRLQQFDLPAGSGAGELQRAL